MTRRQVTWLLPAAIVLVAVVWVIDAGRMDEEQVRRGRIMKSTDNVRTLMVILTGSGVGLEKPWPGVKGKRFVLWLVATNKISKTDVDQLQLLFSPGDRVHSLARAGGPSAYANLTLAKLQDPAFDVGALTSYAGPGDDVGTPVVEIARPTEDRPLLADLSFPVGVILGFASGKARWVSAAELGLPQDQPIVVGAASPVEMLRHLSSR